MIDQLFTKDELFGMTFKRQFFELSYYMNKVSVINGHNEKEFAKYGLDYYLREKFLDEKRAVIDDF